jgi:hypothetical protein
VLIPGRAGTPSSKASLAPALTLKVVAVETSATLPLGVVMIPALRASAKVRPLPAWTMPTPSSRRPASITPSQPQSVEWLLAIETMSTPMTFMSPASEASPYIWPLP